MNWKKIKGFEGVYEVSDSGVIRSVDRYVSHSKGRQLKKGKIIKSFKNQNGYLLVTLQSKGIRKAFQVHRLVCHAFNKNPLNKPQVNHIDGDKLNNKISNLEWCTASENMKHAYDNGLKKMPDNRKGVKCLNNGVVYGSIKEAANKTNSSYKGLSNHLRGGSKSVNNLKFTYI